MTSLEALLKTIFKDFITRAKKEKKKPKKHPKSSLNDVLKT